MNEITENPKILVYSKDGCVFCTRLLQLLDIKEVYHEELKLGKDFGRDDFISKFGSDATFPQVLYGDKNIGGMRESLKYLFEHNLI